MIGLSILLFLGLWIWITRFAIRLGESHAGSKGAFMGFMLTMGGFIVYWIGEYVYIQHTVSQLCKSEGGVTVYVTPEEWRQQIGDEEWEKLVPFTNDEINNSNYQIQSISFDNTIYTYNKGIFLSGNIENAKIALYSFHEITINKYLMKWSTILVDKYTGKVLLKKSYISYSLPNTHYSLKHLNVFLNNVNDCSDYNQKFYDIAKQYSNYH